MRFWSKSIVGWVLVVVASQGLSQPVHAADLQVVGFDLPAVVVAETVNPEIVDAPLSGGNLVRLRIPVSAYVSSQFHGVVSEYAVEIESPHQSLRVVDFWPRNEHYSEIDGTVKVELANQKDGDLNFNVSGGFEPFVRGNAGGKYHRKSSVQQSYQRIPTLQTLTSSGTIRRGYGAFFKFRPGPTSTLEGARQIAILAEVPSSWRADMLQVTMRATGRLHPTARESKTLGESRLWMTAHQEGDLAAAAQARRFIDQERSLRALAASSHRTVQEKSLPTIWHKMGAALDMVEPRIPKNYLTEVIFGQSNQYLEGKSHRLPVGLRVAVLDFWDERDALHQLAWGAPDYLRSNAVN